MKKRLFVFLMFAGAALMLVGLAMSFAGCSLTKGQRIELGAHGATAICGLLQGQAAPVIDAAVTGITLFQGKERKQFESECASASPATMILEYTATNRPAEDDRILSMRVFGDDRIELCIEVADMVEALCEAGKINDDRCGD